MIYISIILFADYNMISHSGDLVGYHSLVTLLPDMNIGLFSALNGADITSRGRRMFHSFVMDLLLGMEPWLNTTTACTFPEPWVTESDEILAAILKEGIDMLSITPEPPVGNYLNNPDDLSPYTGVYGNFYYGHLNIYVDNDISEGQLMLRYGYADPYRLGRIVGDFYMGIASDRMWPAHIQEVSFAKSSETKEEFDLLTVVFPRSGPAVFVRGLKMSDAPPPPDPTVCD